ncbi:MAG: protein kinase, partial [Deltaproteobacteria bacterium]|nr:protein kinase [Deltaproteobacteria bacterium]
MAASDGPRQRPGSRIPLEPGTTFAERYRVVSLLGAGGMAEVFEVEHLHTKRRHALKLLRPAAMADPDSVERFQREASVCANIDSEHIVAVIDCGVDRATGFPFLVMERLYGTDLAHHVREQTSAGTPMPPSLILELLRQVATALDKVHAQGIVHRDLKPANLFLTFPSDGPPRVKILDFGIAKLVGSSPENTLAGRIGTPLYMTSEQILGQEVSPATDLWALALIAFELFCGVPYWDGHTAASLLEAIPDRAARPRPSAIARFRGVSLPAGFDRWFLRCLDPDPAARPPSAGAAIGDLLRVFDPKATQPPPRTARMESGLASIAPAPRINLPSAEPKPPEPAPVPASLTPAPVARPRPSERPAGPLRAPPSERPRGRSRAVIAPPESEEDDAATQPLRRADLPMALAGHTEASARRLVRRSVRPPEATPERAPDDQGAVPQAIAPSEPPKASTPQKPPPQRVPPPKPPPSKPPPSKPPPSKPPPSK